MALTVNTNLASIIAQRSLNNATNGMNTSLERMSTVMDFRNEKDVALASMSEDEQIKIAGGFDHNFLLNKTERGALEYAGSLSSSLTGIKMQAYTTMPAMMIYTANGLNKAGKDGAQYGPCSAVCMECQNVPDSMRHTHFPSPVLKAGEEYKARTEYRFTRE